MAAGREAAIVQTRAAIGQIRPAAEVAQVRETLRLIHGHLGPYGTLGFGIGAHAIRRLEHFSLTTTAAARANAPSVWSRPRLARVRRHVLASAVPPSAFALRWIDWAPWRTYTHRC